MKHMLTALAGLIILAAAPCTAMVFVWSRLTGGHEHRSAESVLQLARAPQVPAHRGNGDGAVYYLHTCGLIGSGQYHEVSEVGGFEITNVVNIGTIE